MAEGRAGPVLWSHLVSEAMCAPMAPAGIWRRRVELPRERAVPAVSALTGGAAELRRDSSSKL